jgi:hypothetical protein|eukprot:COSAG02_NODE_106_length_36326_cov_13.777266_11_plen_57_part_00
MLHQAVRAGLAQHADNDLNAVEEANASRANDDATQAFTQSQREGMQRAEKLERKDI